MWQLFDTPAFAPFVIAGFVLLILLLVEILSFVSGGVSGFLDNLLPDSLVDADVSVNDSSNVSLGLRALDWLYVGRIPTMILLILFIASFCITGFAVQLLAVSVLGQYISPWLASLDAFVISIPMLKAFASLLYPILPRDETSAVSGDSLVGKPAYIVLGQASFGYAAQAKVIDEYGQHHYIMIEPDPEQQDAIDMTLTADDKLMITQKIGERYLVKKL